MFNYFFLATLSQVLSCVDSTKGGRILWSYDKEIWPSQKSKSFDIEAKYDWVGIQIKGESYQYEAENTGQEFVSGRTAVQSPGWEAPRCFEVF